MLVRLPKLACLLLPADFAGNAHFLLDFESCRAFTCSRSPEMIFSTLVLLFCFTWSIRLKTAAAAGHGAMEGAGGAHKTEGTREEQDSGGNTKCMV